MGKKPHNLLAKSRDKTAGHVPPILSRDKSGTNSGTKVPAENAQAVEIATVNGVLSRDKNSGTKTQQVYHVPPPAFFRSGAVGQAGQNR